MISLKKSFNLNLGTFDPNLVPFRMIWINKGSFIMGNSKMSYDEYDITLSATPESESRFSKGYWIGKFMVTNSHWLILKDLTNASNNKENSFLPNQPVSEVTWLEAISFCRLLNIKYKDLLPNGYHFNLPTEAQWEYVARAGRDNTFPIKLFESSPLSNYKNLPIQEVGKNCNAWEVCDMLGSVKEWCFDVAAVYTNESSIDRDGTGEVDNWIDDERYRIRRGGTVPYYREMFWYNMRGGAEGASFRVSLRPISNSDINDPLLKQEGINILGD
jgi:sulfatase modifying factor 1